MTAKFEVWAVNIWYSMPCTVNSNTCVLIKELILLWNGFRILYKRPDLVKSLLELVHDSQRKQSNTRRDGKDLIYIYRMWTRSIVGNLVL